MLGNNCKSNELVEEKIRKLAFDFRNAIDIAILESEFCGDSVFKRFPSGCCGDTVDLLGQYLLEKGLEPKIVCGHRYFDDPEEGTQTHAWLLVDDLIVDITGDQFSNKAEYCNYSETVYVGRGDVFYDLFDVVEDRDVTPFHGIECYNERCMKRLWGLYKKITKYLLE